MKKLTALILSAVVLMTGCSAKQTDSSSIPKVTDKYVSSIYPTMPVKVIVPYSEGGGTDKVARSLIDAASESFTQGISVENVVGEGGAKGMREGANATPDGSVITTITVELTTLPHTDSSVNLSADQFKPILMVNSAYSVLTVRADAPWNTAQDFIAAAKSGEIKIGNSGMGSIWHLAAAGLAKAGNVKFTDMAFEGGSGAASALESGTVDAVTVSYPEVADKVSSGKFKVLTVLAPERLEELPNVPTAKECGYDVSIGTWRGFAVPKDTPDDVANELYYILSKAAGSMDFVQFMVDTNNTIEILNGEDYESRIQKDDAQFKDLVSSLGLK